MGDRETALRVQAKAEEGHTTIARFLLDVDDGPQEQAIQQNLAKLRSKLDSLQGRLQAGTAASDLISHRSSRVVLSYRVATVPGASLVLFETSRQPSSSNSLGSMPVSTRRVQRKIS
jgi:hypothetical protein